MFLKVYKFNFLLALLLVPFLVSADPPGWDKTETMFSNVVNIPSTVIPTLNGVPLENGDWVGVWFNDGGTMVCGGSVEYATGVNLGFSAFGDDPTTAGVKDGFADGESFTWAVYDASDDVTVFGAATYTDPAMGAFSLPFYTHVVASLAAPTFTVSASATPDLFCGTGGDATLSGTAVSGGPITSWDWYDGATLIGSGNDFVVSVAATTTYKLVASDGTNTAEAFVTVTVNTVTAGADALICSDAGDYALADAEATEFLSLNWTTSGTGTFDDAGSVNPTYTPSADDFAAGSVTLTLNVVSLDCGNVSDDMVLSFQAAPSIDILPDQDYACYGDPFPFAGLVDAANYSSLQWFTTNGGGTFDDETILEPTYYPSSSVDYPQLCIIIGVTASAIDPCVVSADDYMDLCFVDLPTAFAGDPQSFCDDVTEYTFADAAVTFDPNWGGTILWETSGDGTFDDPTIQNPTYTFGPNDIANGGTIDFTLTATTAEACDPAVSTTSIFIQLSPSIEIDPDTTVICEGEVMDFAGLVTASNYDEIQWFTTNGGGLFNDETLLEPIYTPSPGVDYAQGCVELGVAAVAIDPCVTSDEDFMQLCFQMLPTVVAGDDATICANETYTTAPTVENTVGPYMWTHNGSGHFDDATLFNATYYPDVSDTYNTIVLTLTAEPISPCVTAVSGSMNLYIECAPYVNAGDDMTICETDVATLVGQTDCTDFTMWATTGDGFFCCPEDLTTQYTPGPGDIAAGCVTLVLVGYPLAPCTMWEVDKMVLCFDPAPEVNAGDDATTCEDTPYQLTGTEANTCGIQWVTYDGTGTFDDETIINPVYTPSAMDAIAGTVHLVMIGAPCLTCTQPAQDTMALTIQRRPVVFAGDNATICEDGSYTLADATAEFVQSVEWAGGDGTFDDATLVNATYTPGAADILAGFVELTITGYTIDPCVGQETSSMVLTVQCLPSIDIVPDSATICYGDSYDFTGQVTGGCYSALQWFTTNGGGAFSDETILEPTYNPSPGIDYPQGCIEIGVAASPISPCTVSAQDFMQLCFQPPVEVDAGDNATICEDATYTMAPTIENGGDLLWTTSGDGSFDDATLENAVYTPGATDIAMGYVELCVEVQGLATCDAASDCMTLYITLLPIADAGDDDYTICEQLCQPPWTNGQIELADATVLYNCGQVWSTAGDGTFDDATAVNPVYTIGDADIAAGSVELCLTAEACDPCTVADIDCTTIHIQYYPEADAGPDVTVCEGDPALLDGTTQYASSVFWDFAFMGEGDGLFNNQTIEDPEYYPGPDDIDRGYVELILIAFPISPCIYPDADVMTVYITRQPVAYAGDDATICEGETYTLNGSVEFATGGFEWKTSGDGTFDDPNSLTAVYTPGAADIAAGGVEICLWAYDASVCTADYFDCMFLTILPPPVVDAGSDGTVCEDLTYQLAGTASNVSSTMWTTAGDGSFDDASLLDAVYTPGSADITNGSVVLTLTGYPLSPCTLEATDDMTLTIQYLPVVDAGDDATTCEDIPFTTSPTITTTNAYTVMWTHDGTGSFDDPTLDNATYTPGAGDAGNTVMLTLTVTPGDFCTTPVVDYMYLYIQPLPVVDAGADATICEDGTFTTSPTITTTNAYSVMWTHNGNGSFDDPTLENATYTPGAGDEGTDVTLTLTVTPGDFCSTPVSDDVVLTIQALPIVNAGDDATICEDGSYTTAPTITTNNAYTVMWTHNGNGSFDDPTLENATYTPGAGDAGTDVTLTLTVTPGDFCSTPVTDDMVLTIQTLPSAFAGDDATICEDGSYTLADATADNYSSLLWAGGDGTFDDATILNPTYTPGSGDIALGYAELCLTAEPIDPCTVAATDCMMLYIQWLPTADAGADATICEDGTYTLADATAANYSSLLWAGGDGTFDDATMLNPTYTPGAADIAAGTVDLCLTAEPISPCTVSATDCMTLTIQWLPTADAGADATICEDGTYTLADATAANYSALSWAGGDGTFDDATILNPVYTPGTGDIAMGYVELCLTAEPIDPCTVAATDCMMLYIQWLPTADAGADATICEDGTYTLADATAANYSSLLWAGGDGTFDDATTLNPVYTPGTGDIAAGTVDLCLTAEPIDPCTVAATDCMTLTIQWLPTAFAGDDAVICEGDDYILADATAENYSALSWTGGDGTFDDATTLNPTYTPGSGDISAGTVDLCLIAAPIDPCTVEASDCMTLTIQWAPTAFAGDDATICEDGAYTLADATAANYSALAWTGGDGTFDDATALNPVYTPGTGDIAAGTVDLCLTASPIDPCTVAATDCMTLAIQLLPTADAGGDLTICDNEDFATLNGVCENGSSNQWTTTGTGFFDDETACQTMYYITPEDIVAGSVTLCLEVFPVSPCTVSATDCMTLTIAPSPEANAGDDVTICEGDVVQLNGSAENYSSVLWETRGDGAFDDDAILNPVYTPGAGDVTNQGVWLILTAYPSSACNIPALDSLYLQIDPQPEIIVHQAEYTAGCADLDDAASPVVWKPISLDPSIIEINFAGSVEWTILEGYGSFNDNTLENPDYNIDQQDQFWSGDVVLQVVASGSGQCTITATATITIHVPQQIIKTHYESIGWMGVSSYVDLSNVPVPDVMYPVVGDPPGSSNLIIQINKDGEYYWPVPDPPINQLGNWNPNGYKAKFSDPDGCLPIFGDAATSQTFHVSESFTYLPVLTNDSIPINDLLGANKDTVLLIFDWRTNTLWTPTTNNPDLTTVYPGRTYLLVQQNMNNEFDIDFGAIDPSIVYLDEYATKDSYSDMGNNSPWNDVYNTSFMHFLLFDNEVLKDMQPGDIIGAFNQYDECVGMSEFIDRDSFFKLLANGDDPMTQEIDGYVTGEMMNFKLYRQATGETFEVSFTYDPEYPNYDGLFAVYGVSKVVDMTMTITSVNDINNSYNVNVFPNPAKDVINIASDYDMKSITLVNYVGQNVLTQSVSGNTYQINVSNFVKGMYFVRIETTDGTVITKRIAIE